MKIHLLLLFLTTTVIQASSQTKFTISFNQGFGNLPTFKYDPTKTYSVEKANQIFKYVKDSTGIEFRYSYAGCEKRAHAVSLLLNGKKIGHYKIWNFDPSLISLFYRQEQPYVTNKVGLSPTVSWRYHVAILLFVRDNNEINPMVIDPAVSDKIISEKEWLRLQHATTTFYTYLDPQWYNYATTDKFKYFCNGTAYPFPSCMLGLLTGDFFLNNDISLTDMWIEEALAVNQLGMKIIDDIIAKESSNSDKRKAFVALVESFDNLTNALKGKPSDNIKPYNDLLGLYQKEFLTLRDSWKTRLDLLRN